MNTKAQLQNKIASIVTASTPVESASNDPMKDELTAMLIGLKNREPRYFATVKPRIISVANVNNARLTTVKDMQTGVTHEILSYNPIGSRKTVVIGKMTALGCEAIPTLRVTKQVEQIITAAENRWALELKERNRRAAMEARIAANQDEFASNPDVIEL